MGNFNAKAARAKRPVPFWVDSLMRDIQHLSVDEVGAYLLIQMAMWSRESCNLEDDDVRLARVARVSKYVWVSRIGPTLRALPGMHSKDGFLQSEKLLEEAAKTEAFCQKQSNAKTGTNVNQPNIGHSAKSGMRNIFAADFRGNPDKSLKYNNVASSADHTGDVSEDATVDHPFQEPNISKNRDTKVSPATDVAMAVVETFNKFIDDHGMIWPKVAKLTPTRIAVVKARLRACGGMDGWMAALEKASQSRFLRGERCDWIMTFDFLIKAANFTKLMEGNYDDRGHTNGTRQSARESRESSAERSQRIRDFAVNSGIRETDDGATY